MAPNAGAPLIKAVFPRVFIDANREPYEFDPSMFVEPLPSFVTTSSNKISAGLGTIAKVVSYGEKIYSGKLHLSDALNRVNNYYLPYHDSLEKLINITKESFGGCALIDCHSMPSNRIGNGSRNNKSPADTTTPKVNYTGNQDILKTNKRLYKLLRDLRPQE